MKPVTQINVLSIKPDKVDEFFEADRSYIGSATLPKGVLGSRVYKSLDGRSVARVSMPIAPEMRCAVWHSLRCVVQETEDPCTMSRRNAKDLSERSCM